MPSSDLQGNQACMWHTYMQAKHSNLKKAFQPQNGNHGRFLGLAEPAQGIIESYFYMEPNRHRRLA